MEGYEAVDIQTDWIWDTNGLQRAEAKADKTLIASGADSWWFAVGVRVAYQHDGTGLIGMPGPRSSAAP